MNPTSKDIATMLANESSLGLTLATDLFYKFLPPEKAGVTGADIVTVIDNGGDAPLPYLDKSSSDYYFPSVNVQVRNIDFDSGYAIIFAIYQWLHNTSQVVINSTNYTLIKAIEEPRLLHMDQNKRYVFVVNFDVQRRPD
jgi:hypothetical protein